MPTILLLKFPLGRYHANPWGRHVNEGEVEIPPSPWRLLRALYSVWKTRTPELADDVVQGLFDELSRPPTFYVPRHSISHTRHYYPDSKSGTDRTLDAFAVFGPEAQLGISWPVDPTDEQRKALDRLANSLPYFGRADSPCEAELASDWESTDHEVWTPVDVADEVSERAAVATVLAPELPLQLDTLLARPLDVRRSGLLFPPGSRFVGYQRTRLLKPLRRPRPKLADPPTAVRFSVLQPALPPEADALIYTDLLRQASLSKLNANEKDRPPTLLGGRTESAAPMDGHQHAHYLPIFGEDRRLSELVVWIPKGLPQEELSALAVLQQLRSSWQKDWRLTVRMSGYGTVGQIAPELVGPVQVWRSVTPFVPARYPKLQQEGTRFIEDEIARELNYRGQSAPHLVEQITDRDWREFVRYRPSRRFASDKRQGQANRAACFLELTFPHEVSGPISLGHLSHFGLGLFRPVR